jgi:hypothetical protein
MARRILDPEALLECLEDELDRGHRYDRPFSVIVYQSPARLEPDDRSLILGWAASVVRSHVRISDAVGVIEDRGNVVLVLPETNAEGAKVAGKRFLVPLDRLTFREEEPADSWGFNAASFPDDAGLIRLYIDRLRALVLRERPMPPMRTGKSRPKRSRGLRDLRQDLLRD